MADYKTSDLAAIIPADIDPTVDVVEISDISAGLSKKVTVDDLIEAGDAITSIYEHTATQSDEHAVELIVNTAGNGDVKALDIVYNTGALPSTSEEAVILVNIDESSAVGGEVVGLEVIATEGSASIDAVLVGANVGIARQFSGTFTDPDSGLVLAVDRLTEFITAGTDIQMFVADNDHITIGNATKFTEIEFLLAVPSSQNIQPTFEYSTGVGTWATFVPTDGTNGMRNNGVVLFNPADIPSWALGAGSEYLIRITRTRNTVVTPPTESKIQIVVATEYYWDKNGDVKVKDLEANTANLTGVPSTTVATGDKVLVQDVSDTDTLKTVTAQSIADLASSGGYDYILLQHELASGTDGGNGSSSSWNQRPLNTEVYDTGGHCTLSANRFTLAEGTYRINAVIPYHRCNRHKARLVEDPAGTPTYPLYGQSGHVPSGTVAIMTNGFIKGEFTVGVGGGTFQIESYTQFYGYGEAFGYSTDL